MLEEEQKTFATRSSDHASRSTRMISEKTHVLYPLKQNMPENIGIICIEDTFFWQESQGNHLCLPESAGKGIVQTKYSTHCSNFQIEHRLYFCYDHVNCHGVFGSSRYDDVGPVFAWLHEFQMHRFDSVHILAHH